MKKKNKKTKTVVKKTDGPARCRIVAMKLKPTEYRVLKAKAVKHTDGNVSRLLREAGLEY